MQSIRSVNKSKQALARSVFERPPQPAHQVYVGGVAWAATNEDIRKHFSSCGNVVSVCIYVIQSGCC